MNTSVHNSAYGQQRNLRSVAEGINEDGNDDGVSWNVADRDGDVAATASQSKESVNFKSSNLLMTAAKQMGVPDDTSSQNVQQNLGHS